MSLVTLAMVSVTAWMPTILIREHALPARTAGLLFGTIIAVTGVASAALAGVFADRASRRGGAAGPIGMTLVCVAAGFGGFVVLSCASSPLLLMIGAVLVFSPLSMSLIAGIVAMSDLSPPRSRGQITSIYFLFTGVIGTAGGPALVGYVNDLVGGSAAHHLARVLSTTGLVATLSAVAIAGLTLVRVRSLSLVESADE